MSSISHNGDSISYTYDPDGIRTSKTVNGTTTKYHVMNGTLLGQTKENDTIVFLYDEKANKYGFDYNGTKYYYIFNVQGDVIGILNQAGQKIVSYTYDPWGKVLSVDGSEASTIGQINPIRYRGYYYDTETGFYYLQSRYYDPTTRRFLNSDILVGNVGSVGQNNLFQYCSNNPVNLADPIGYLVGEIAVCLLFVAVVASIPAVIGAGASTALPSVEMPSFPVVEFPTIEVPVYNPPASGYSQSIADSVAIGGEIAVEQEATIAKPSKPRNPNDLHHIVPKALNDWRIDYARLRMEVADIKLNDPVNLISLPRTFHARMHGNSYRDMVYDIFWRNTCGWNYSTSFQEKRADVLESLSYLRTRIIVAYYANDPYNW